MEIILCSIVLSIPYYFIWNALAPTYFSWLPAVYQHLPFWHCMGLFVLFAILRTLLLPSSHIIHKKYWKKSHKDKCC